MVLVFEEWGREGEESSPSGVDYWQTEPLVLRHGNGGPSYEGETSHTESRRGVRVCPFRPRMDSEDRGNVIVRHSLFRSQNQIMTTVLSYGLCPLNISCLYVTSVKISDPPGSISTVLQRQGTPGSETESLPRNLRRRRPPLFLTRSTQSSRFRLVTTQDCTTFHLLLFGWGCLGKIWPYLGKYSHLGRTGFVEGDSGWVLVTT